jgi:D-3-phosphoglycerate dehydrogenase / 2-oxoglutarate reductase
MSFHVLIPDNVDQAAIDLLNQQADISVTAPGKMSRDQTKAAIPTANALIVRSATTADHELLMLAPELKVIARAGVGVDNIDLDVATQQGIVVMNTPGGNTIATAEHTFALMLALSRYVPRAHLAMREGRWDRKLFQGVELRGKTLGIIGFGRIGREVAKRAQAFQMRVIEFDPFVDAATADSLGVTSVSLDDLYAQADYITLHTVVTDETREMINAAALGKMKSGVRIINAARGALINEADLQAAVSEGRVAGVAMDVYSDEPPPADHPLVGLDHVVHTPHLAASTAEAQVAVAVEAAQKVIAGLVDGAYSDVVNPAVLG